MTRFHALSAFTFILSLLLLPLSGYTGPLEDNAAKIRTLAEQGDAKAQSHLGYLYYVGEGVPQDYGKAVEWYRKAATQGDKDAQYNLAVAYAFGEGVKQDLKEASIWYRRSAVQGHVISQYSLGLSYAYGEGVPQDAAEAARWFQKAAEQGYIRAQVQLGSAYHTGEGVTQDYGKAIQWYRMAADRGDATAQYNLGTLYRSGKGVEQNYQQAIRWFTMAADQGYAAAQNELASLQRTAGRVASRPTPQLRPGTDKTTPGIEQTPATTAPAVSTTSETTSPITTNTASTDQQPTEESPVEVAQTPAKPSTLKSSDGIAPSAATEIQDKQETDSGSKGGLIGAINRMFKSPAPEVEVEPEVEIVTAPEPEPETEVTTAVTQTPAKGKTVETQIHREITVQPEQVEVISNMPQTDAIVRAKESEEDGALSIDETEPADEVKDEKPGLFSRLFGSSKKEEETTEPETLAVIETEPESTEAADTEIVSEPEPVVEMESMAETELTESIPDSAADNAMAYSENADAPVESEPVSATDEEQPAKSGVGGFFNRLFGSRDKTASGESPEQVALAQPSTTAESTIESETVELQEYSITAGRKALEAGDYDDAIQQFRPLAEAGNAEAQSHLASMYYVGRSVEKDYNQAFSWYRRAAEQGHMDSQYSLGNMYLLGEGVTQNNHLAALWYNKAAQQGHTAAEHNLASLKRLMQQSGETLDIPQETEVATLEPATVTEIPVETPTDVEVPLSEVAVEEPPVEEPSVPVSSNYPQTDEIVRVSQDADDSKEDTMDGSNTETDTEPEVAGDAKKSGIGGFFSRLFGKADSGETVETEVVESESMAEAMVEEEQAPVTTANEEKSVKSYAIDSAPASEPLSNEPEVVDNEFQPVMLEETEPVTAAVAEESEEKAPSLFEKLFGPGDSGTKTANQENADAPEAETMEVEDAEPEVAVAMEETTQPATTLEEEPASTEMETSDANETTATQKKKGFLARLFGSDKEEEDTAVEETATESDGVTSSGSSEAENYEELYAGEEQTTEIQLAETGQPDDDLYQTPVTEAQTNDVAEVSEEDQFGFFDRMFGAKDQPAETAVAESEIVEQTNEAEPVPAPEPVVEAEPVEYITETVDIADSGELDIGKIRPQAIQGDADAQLQLADAYYTGNGIEQDYTQAFLWYRRAAQQGNVDAQFKLGNIYLMGEGIDQDDRQAMLWYEKAADQGHEAARHNHENLQRLAASQTVAEIEAENTPVVTQTPSLEPGSGLNSTAVEDEYNDKLSTTEPDTTGAKIVNQDEDKGFWQSAGELFGIGDDEEDSVPDAQQTIEVEDEYDEDLPSRSIETEQEPVERTSDAQTLYDRGMAYAFGDGVAKNYQRAAEYFQQAAEQGHAGAEYRLGVAYAYGEGVERDLDISAEWYRKAAQHGNTTAQRTLASMYLDGNGVPQDKVMAHAWYRIVADNGNVMDIRRRDMLQEQLSEPELTESERIAQEINTRLHKL